MKNIYEMLAEEYKKYPEYYKHVQNDKTNEDWKLKVFKIHPKRLLAGVPDRIDDNDPQLKEIFQKIYDIEFDWYKSKYHGYNDELYIMNQIHLLTEFPSTFHSPTDQIKVTRYLRFLESKKGKAIKPLRDTLEKACNNDENKIKVIKDWLIQNGYCDPDTLTYKDRSSGNMKLLTCFLKGLHPKGYTEELTNKEIRLIAKNSFRFEIGLSTIEHTKDNAVHFVSFSSYKIK